MKYTFEEFVEICKKSMKYDPWARKRGLVGYCEEIYSEAEELANAAKKEDFENMQEELGDVLIDIIHACLHAEMEGLFNATDVMEGAMRKLNRRKPFLQEGRQVTLEEAREIWKKVKEEEKNG
jgi:NTP pyrophosphatase (non-canonical NTP hydrolase)